MVGKMLGDIGKARKNKFWEKEGQKIKIKSAKMVNVLVSQNEYKYKQFHFKNVYDHGLSMFGN
jgi:hypothetical protein